MGQVENLQRRAHEEGRSPIRVRKAATGVDGGGRISFDAHFLKTPFSRKVYVGLEAKFEMYCPPHAHESAHHFCCIHGKGMRLAVETCDGRIDVMPMIAGHWYYVDANVPHQVEMKGQGVLEAYSEKSNFRDAMVARALGRAPVIRVLDYDLFEKFETQAASHMAVIQGD